MKKLLLTIALVLTACGTEGDPGATGPAGPTGPSGPPGSYAKGDIYCRGSNGALPLNDVVPAFIYVTVARCDAPADLPLTGSCSQTDALPTGFWQSRSRADSWGSATVASGWECQWANSAGSNLSSLSNTIAEICCIAQ